MAFLVWGFGMSLRTLFLAVLSPLVLLVIALAGMDLQKYRSLAQSQTVVHDVARHSNEIGDLVHEVQKERGMSAGFTASSGRSFAREIVQQRSATDGALAVFEQSQAAVGQMAPDLTASAVQQLGQIRDIRMKIDVLDLTVPELAGYYTGIINDLLATSTRVRTTDVAEVASLLMEGQELVARAKESAGLERAMGATGLGAESFPLVVHQRFVDLGARQRALLEVAELVLGRSGMIEEINALPSAVLADEMRQAIRGLQYGGATVSITGPEWFAASTAWIDDLRLIEGSLAAEIMLVTEMAKEKAQNRLLFEAVGVSLATLMFVGFAVYIVDGLARKISKLTDIMNQFIDGNFDAWVPYIRNRGSIGKMADAIYKFKQLTRAATRQKFEDEAQLNARHQQVVNLVTEGLNALARADLSLRFGAPLADEYDTIRTDFNASVTRLRDVLKTIATTVHELEGSAEQMLRNAGDLADQTSTQVNTIQGTAQSVNRLTAALTQTQHSIHDAKDLASDTKSRADQSGEIVQEAVAAMDRISESSSKIEHITAIIEDLSFQTNLLALNAGVEAARAGASGKGFAVVASEVRELASRSADAALEIKTLIADSGREVQSGVDLVGQTGQALQAIVAQVAKVDDTLASVSDAAAGQARDLSDVNVSMESLRDLTNRNSQVADDCRTSSNDLAGHAQKLGRIVSEFNLGDGASDNFGAVGNLTRQKAA
jgi:methyl-accepting chemotaxis protein